MGRRCFWWSRLNVGRDLAGEVARGRSRFSGVAWLDGK